jgi:hypothetical protein
MTYWDGVWKSLKFTAGKTGKNFADSVSYRYLRKKNGNLVYINNRGYDNVLIHVARQKAMQFIENQVNTLFPKYKRYLEKQMRDSVLEQQVANLTELIKAGERVDKKFGVVEIDGYKFIAKNKYGDKVPEALMLYYVSDEQITIQGVFDEDENPTESCTSNVVCFIDLVASVTVQSSKNLVLTQVQGRDYTRKELVSGGDLSFSVTGKIVGDQRGVYPENDVKKFIQIMQYGGIIKVNHYLFSQFNIKQIIVKDYNLNSSDYKNVQPYSFNCVAVEPDEDVLIQSDAIGTINKEIKLSSMNQRYKLILNNKLTSILANTVANTVSSNVTSSLASGLDELVPNI